MASNTYFQFKQFRINQEHCAMKVGTDGVILGAWANISYAHRILDIGTGTGLIALMLAQRNTKAPIDAIEIDKKAFLQAKENIKISPWSDKITVYNKNLNLWNPIYKYDCIISNPPFFEEMYLSDNKQRNIARHTQSLSIEDLLKKTTALLLPKGKSFFIFPYQKSSTFIEIAEKYNLYCIQRVNVYPNKDSLLPKRVLLTFSFNKIPIKESNLILELERHQYTSEYKKIVKDFYL